jgi:ABC-type multidrug transport system fused ATPase/permease subunit
MLRLVEPCGGRILVGGKDTSEMGLRLLRSTITIIPQDPVMFAGTLRWNIDPTFSYGDKEVESACASSGIQEVRSNFSLAEEVKEYGQNFSVGERQLVCMARALLRHNLVMLFDEATASMDVESDARLQKVLREDLQGATILTVAHRLGTIIDYDRILSLHKGEVAELDTPANLFARPGGIFASLAHEAGITRSGGLANDVIKEVSI